MKSRHKLGLEYLFFGLLIFGLSLALLTQFQRSLVCQGVAAVDDFSEPTMCHVSNWILFPLCTLLFSVWVNYKGAKIYIFGEEM